MTPRPWGDRPWPAAVPRFVTPRNYDRPTLGPEVAATMRRLGFEPMPWNLANWDTMYEYELVDDPQHGAVKRLWYREARITVPRQSSKTLGTLTEQVDRMVNGEARGWGERPVAAFTMQHASDARDKMVNEWMPIIQGSAEWAPDLETESSTQFVLSNGKESIKWPGYGRMITFPPNASGAHGGVLDRVDIDEAFAHVDNRAEKGSRPAMITRPSPQIVIKSTAGTAESLYLSGKVDGGRERVTSGAEGHVYYLEFSADEEGGDDIHNPAHWPRWMPALGYTQSLEALTIEHDTMVAEPDGSDEWARAFCNLWTGTVARIIPRAAWERCRDAPDPATDYPGSVIAGDRPRLWLAADSSPYPSPTSSVSIAGYRADGSIHVEVLAHHPDKHWLAEYIGKVTRRQVIEKLYIDPKGPINSVLPDIRDAANANIEIIDAETMAALSTRFLDGVVAGTVRHRGQPPLDDAVDGAAKRTLLDSWAFARRPSAADITPLVSCAAAHWGAATNPQRGLIAMAPGRG